MGWCRPEKHASDIIQLLMAGADREARDGLHMQVRHLHKQYCCCALLSVCLSCETLWHVFWA